MKKLRILSVLVLLTTVFLINGCKKDNNIASCSELSERFSQAINNYISNPTEATCNAYVDALRDYVNGCATLTPSERATLNAELDDADCSSAK